MNKTPIMILQEVTMKCSMSVPIYTEISSVCGTHQNQFTIGVKWETYNAKGVGTSKKEAKQNAAKEMLSLLLSSKKITEESLLSVSKDASIIANIMPQKLVTSVTTNTLDCIPNDSPKESFISSPCPPVSAFNLDDTFVNYVGLLQEYCVSKSIPSPHFDTVNVSGPSHASLFTVSCDTICGHEEASATTKKNAKQEVAKKMLQRLTGRTEFSVKSETLKTYVEKLNVEFMNLSIDEPQPNNFETEEVLTIYNKIKHRPVVSTSQLQIKDYHQELTNLCHNIPQAKKVPLLSVCAKRKCDLDDISHLKDIIRDALQKEVEKVICTQNKSQFIVGLRLPIWPTILQIGMGETMQQAERQALYKFFELIFLFLK